MSRTIDDCLRECQEIVRRENAAINDAYSQLARQLHEQQATEQTNQPINHAQTRSDAA